MFYAFSFSLIDFPKFLEFQNLNSENFAPDFECANEQTFFCGILKNVAQNFSQNFQNLDSEAPEFIFNFDFYKNSSDNLFFIIETNNQDAILRIANEFSQHLPLSINFVFSELQVFENLQDFENLKISEFSARTHFHTALEMREFTSNFDFKSFKFCKKMNLPNDFENFLDDLVQKLKNKQSVILQTAQGVKKISLHEKNSKCIICDIASIQTLFRVNQTQLDLMASFQKPSINLSPKEVFKDEFAPNSVGQIECILPYDFILSALCAKLLKDDFTHIFEQDAQDCENSNIFDFNHSKRDFQNLCVAENGLFIDTRLAQNSNFQALLKENLTQSNAQKTLVFYISSNFKNMIFLKDGDKFKEILNLDFDINPKNLIQKIKQNYESGEELIKNTREKTSLDLDFENLDFEILHSENFTQVFGAVAMILGMNSLDSEELDPQTLDSQNSESKTPNSENSPLNSKIHNLAPKDLTPQFLHAHFQMLLKNANDFVRAKGPRIDYILKKSESGELMLDYPRILRSTLSFRCAGMDDVILSYGVIDSFCEFLANIARDIQTNYALGENLEILLFGDAFSHSIFFTRILNFLPKNITLLLPKDGALDLATQKC